MTDPIIRVGVGVICLNEKGQFLMGRRVGTHGNQTWAIPGGYIEFGESFEEAASREVMEEAGLELSRIEILKPANYFFENKAKQHVTIYCIGRISGEPKIMEPDKMDSWQFFDDWHAMPQPTFVTYQQDVDIEDIKAYKIS